MLDDLSVKYKEALSAAFTARLTADVQRSLDFKRNPSVVVLVRAGNIQAHGDGPDTFGKCVSRHYSADDFDKTIFSGPPGRGMAEHVMGALEVRIRELGA